MAMLLRSVGRQSLLRQHAVFVNKIPMSSSTAYEEMRKYWDKNRQLNRPLSPFLSSYRPHLAMTMSLTHRVTGVGMSVVVSGVSVLMLCLPESYPYSLSDFTVLCYSCVQGLCPDAVSPRELPLLPVCLSDLTVLCYSCVRCLCPDAVSPRELSLLPV
ncbi:succinate dehydrogenase cytochrome b560 subunit, mitochondrial-like isoform X2 [Haliotis rufescens]|uniref:succinate dehydrogenase cytochrome b560 subunit, mitochondrial-like isoform X2 n=1 Tax=Haliotis rufescens TaxID=6454 RepID=UPI00201EEEA8|nr:succinate dehydrogenase cytochrome b560 subunit, mitochondrial-like isoform X2 [Haliotis rufescens]